MAVIEVKQLYKAYHNHIAVHDVSFTVEQGEIFGLVGPNGAGKTTTVECVAGLRRADRGQISVLGRDPLQDRDELRQRIGVQLQASSLPDKMKVWEALDLFSSLYDDPADWRMLLDYLGLAEKRNSTVDHLSGGQRQRLSLALALVGKPELAILDELTTGLDPQARRDVWQLIEQIRDDGVTVLLVTHFMEEAERLCDRVAVIDRGRAVAIDTPAGLIASLSGQQRVRFRPSVPLADSLLSGLPEVEQVSRKGEQILVTGKGNLLHAVSSVLAQNAIVAEELRVEQGTLDDVFVALTGHTLEMANGHGR